MLEIAIIITLTMASVEAIKFFFVTDENVEAFKKISFIPVLGIAVVLNMLNAGIFGDAGFATEALKLAAKDGIIYGIEAAGVYGLTKAALGKS
jgi:amino acid permease